MSQLNIYNGIIGFFDILGYQSLLGKNEPEDVAQKILPILTGLNIGTTDVMIEFIKSSGKNNEVVNLSMQMVRSIQWLVFSDTILIALPVANNSAHALVSWMTFLPACIYIQNRMFLAGLPLRGVINYGKFFIKDNFFAGKCIIESYKLCQKLELSACVLTERASNEVDKSSLIMKHFKQNFRNVFFYNYQIPIKHGTIQLDTLTAHTWTANPPKDFHSMVMDSFGNHNKDIPQAANIKITNTEQWLSFLGMKRKNTIISKTV
jgi:hypothetical protein